MQCLYSHSPKWFIFTVNRVVCFFLYLYALLLKTEACSLLSNKENKISMDMVLKM